MENLNDDQIPHDISHTGLCPACGVEVEEETTESWAGKYETVYMVTTTQFCPACGWQSVPLYDVE